MIANTTLPRTPATSPPTEWMPHGVDLRLVARAQMRAGRNAHHLANKLQAYYLVTKLYGEAVGRKDRGGFAELTAMRERAETELRAFAFGP
jgi:hypothetical protein